ncbi:MAG TPA: hypothetical protein VES67_25395 [Vicinamibacterales bacterium]|nr:hypothetical protein [Vicinamibacterales bacterium]
MRTALVGIALAVTLAMPGAAAAQDQAPPASSSQPAQTSSPPPAAAQVASDLERVKAQLNRAPVLKLDEGQLRFYVEVIAKQPSIADMIGSYDLMNGPTKRGAPMTHQEFLNMVTPKELYGSGGIKAGELLQFALTNWLGQQVIKRAMEDLRNARTEREVQEIRARIERELAALRGGG